MKDFINNHKWYALGITDILVGAFTICMGCNLLEKLKREEA
jgi:hypothetical protein